MRSAIQSALRTLPTDERAWAAGLPSKPRALVSIGVARKLGYTISTRMPWSATSPRSTSKNWVSAALALQ